MEKNTLFTISERTGYSVSTVSRVLSGKGREYRISDKAISAITECAREWNYTPNLIAKGLRTKKTGVIGLLVPSIANPFFANFSSIITSCLIESGYNMFLVDSMENEDIQDKALDSFLARNVDGMIVVPVGTSPERLEKISLRTPVVLIDRYYPETVLPYVCTDNYLGGSMATEYLLSRGYRRLLAIQGARDSMPNRERVRGFEAIVGHAGIHVKTRVCGSGFSEINGYSETMEAFRSGFRPDAIFAFSITILLGAIRAIKELGLSIPGDVAIISFDDNDFLDYLDPPVTRIAQPVREIGQYASDMLLKLIDGTGIDDGSAGHILFPPNLIEGRSC